MIVECSFCGKTDYEMLMTTYQLLNKSIKFEEGYNNRSKLYFCDDCQERVNRSRVPFLPN